MSMFHELMMRKKEEIMYATIKGSLTENDGVFSGFSTSNYLEIQDSIPTTNFFEYCFKFKTTIGTIQKIFGVNGSTSYNGISILANGSIAYTIKRTGGYTDIAFDEIVISDNIEYILKINFNNGNFICSLYDTNGTLIKTQTKTSSYTEEVGYDMVIGKGASRSFSGSIDLNKSYIKLGSTKYNLQAVVGYTVVGSPTITDGVVSGFSLSNYLTIQAIDFSQPFEIKTSFILNSSATSSNADNYIFNTYSGRYFALSVTSTRYVNIRYGDGASWTVKTSQYRCSIDTKYYIKLVYNGTSLNIYISTDDITYTLVDSIETSQSYPQSKLCIGVLAINGSSIGGIFYGSIDIANSLIKVNNKLYFNGQQA